MTEAMKQQLRGKVYKTLASMSVGDQLYVDTRREANNHQTCGKRYGIPVTQLKVVGVGWRIERVSR